MGKLYERGAGRGFRRFHRASARGQYAVADSGNQIRQTKIRRINQTTYEVYVDTKYAKILESVLGRVVIGKTDRDEAQQDLNKALAKIF